MSMHKYGDPVAIRVYAEIQFGTISEIFTREGASGETTEFHVSVITDDGPNRQPIVIHDESDLFPLERRYGLDDFILGSQGVKLVRAEVKAWKAEAEKPADAKPVPTKADDIF
jgi:hypothetical protein